MDVTVIQVPSGDDHHASSRGARRLIEEGAVELFTSRGVAANVEAVGRQSAFRDTASSSAEVNRQLAMRVKEAHEKRQLPVVLAGSCNACLGVLGGFGHERCGAVWLDAHADFNTPESTTSGFFPGMSAAVITGHCYRDYWAQIGDNAPLAEETVLMFGVRDLSPEAERKRLQSSRIEVVEWRDGAPAGDILAALDRLSRRVSEVYLHVDFDAFAPEIAPGVADQPVAGGLSLAEAESIIRGTGERFLIRAATLATYAPDRDLDDRTLKLALRVLEMLADYAWDAPTRS